MEMATDIEVLKVEVQGLHRAITDVSVKMDVLLSLQVQLVRLQEQHDNTRKALDRAFEKIRDVSEESTATANRINTTQALVRGAAGVGVLLFAFAQWYAMSKIEAIEGNTALIQIIDRRIGKIENQIEDRR
jgi:hypothetical protein